MPFLFYGISKIILTPSWLLFFTPTIPLEKQQVMKRIHENNGLKWIRNYNRKEAQTKPNSKQLPSKNKL